MENIRNLLVEKEGALTLNKLSNELIESFDKFIIEASGAGNELSVEVLNVYQKFLAMKQDAPEGMKLDLFSVIKNFIKEKISKKEFLDALFLYRFLMIKSKMSASSFCEIAEIFVGLGEFDLAIDFIKVYEAHETNKPLRFLSLANFYNLHLKDYKTAIKYYELYLKIDETKAVVYTIIASLYAKEYGELSLKDQIYYFEKAYKLKPTDRLVLHSLAFGYEKLGDKEKANKFYRKLLENNPTETDYYNYGAFLISCGEFEVGHKYFAHRFNIDDQNLEYPVKSTKGRKWNFRDDISQKTLLVHYEQGFGDTFMYCRFVPLLNGVAKRVIFVVQHELFDLIKSAEFMGNIEVVSDEVDIETLDYDEHMALLDVPFVLKIRSEFIPNRDKYLDVKDDEVKKYAEKYIKPSKNLKVGISYQGNKASNYMERDIDFSRFKRVFALKNIDFYSFSMEDESSSEVVSLGKTFKSFTDTACALKNMDVVVSTDNVILNLAGALGVKTYGLFNKHPNFRWYKLDSEDVGWYNSVKPIQARQHSCWSGVFSELINQLSCDIKL